MDSDQPSEQKPTPEEPAETPTEREADPLAQLGYDLVSETLEAAEAESNTKTSSISFPEECLVGSLGDFARVMSEGSEVPPEFYFACGLTMVGAIAADRLKLSLSFDVEPRLYTVLLGESYRVKKSTALKHSITFFTEIAGELGYCTPSNADKGANKGHRHDFGVLSGVASAEGLIRCLQQCRSIVLAYDELRALIDKAAITGSSLLAAVTSLFEGTRWENPTKRESESISCDDAHLSILGCCTLNTYDHIWTREAIAIGLTNRLFVVTSDAKSKVSWSKPRDEAVLKELRRRICGQLGRFLDKPLTFDIEKDAWMLWDKWYHALPASEHARRLETIGFRLLALIALTTDRDMIDAETVSTVCRILDYEYNVRVLTDPIDADATVAKLEESIRRQLDRRGPLTDRQLRQHTNANKYGLWAYKAARTNLIEHKDIIFDPKSATYELMQEARQEA